MKKLTYHRETTSTVSGVSRSKHASLEIGPHAKLEMGTCLVYHFTHPHEHERASSRESRTNSRPRGSTPNLRRNNTKLPVRHGNINTHDHLNNNNNNNNKRTDGYGKNSQKNLLKFLQQVIGGESTGEPGKNMGRRVLRLV